MAITHKAGNGNPVVTDVQTMADDSVRKVVVIEGKVADLAAIDWSEDSGDYLPSGYSFEKSTLAPSGNGLGKLTVQCMPNALDASIAGSPNRTTFRISMEAVTYDLIDHPHLESVRDICTMWLATDEAERCDGGSYFYKNQDGELLSVGGGPQNDFCAAYMAGIKTFNRYYPVLERITTWDNPPGVTKEGRSYTGGTFTRFSAIGTYEIPPVEIAGYASGGWFKSGDDWTQNEGRDWTRTEQWTWTPEAAGGAHGWIYGGEGGGE